MGLCNPIRAFGENFAILDDDRGKRPATFGDIASGDVYRALGEIDHEQRLRRRLTPMKAFAAGLAGLIGCGMLAAPAAAMPQTDCRLVTPVTEVAGLAQIPAALSKMVGPIADIGAPFNSTDDVDDPALPFRRLIRAGHRADDWFLWYEHGGITYFWQVVVAHVGADGAVTTVANAGTIADTLCVVTDGAFAGTVPPYPAGAWEAGSF